jgi:DNA-binding MarR family transcriptional regulator
MVNNKNLYSEFIGLSHIIKREMSKSLENIRKFSGLTVSGTKIISYLFRHGDDEIYQKDLEAAFSVRPSTISRSLKKLEEQGYIARQLTSSDFRLRRIILTEKAMEINDTFNSVLEEVFGRMTDGMAEDETELFIDMLKKMKRNLGEEQENKL